MFAFCSPRLFSLFSAAFVKLSQFPQISPALHQMMTRSPYVMAMVHPSSILRAPDEKTGTNRNANF